MTTEEVVIMRTILKDGKDLPLHIVMNNLTNDLNEHRDCVVWDDARGMIWNSKPNIDPITSQDRPILISGQTYTDIQVMEIACAVETFRSISPEIGYKPNQVDGIIKRFNITDDNIIESQSYR